MINKPSFIIWASIILFLLTILSDYHGYQTTLAVNNLFADKRKGKMKLLKKQNFHLTMANIGTIRCFHLWIIQKIRKEC